MCYYDYPIIIMIRNNVSLIVSLPLSTALNCYTNKLPLLFVAIMVPTQTPSLPFLGIDIPKDHISIIKCALAHSCDSYLIIV